MWWKAALSALVYALWLRFRWGVLRRAVKEGRAAGPSWFADLWIKGVEIYANLVGVRIASMGGPGLKADPSKRYLYVWHPHGFVSYVPSVLMGAMARGGKPHGRMWFGTCAPLLFNIPVLGEFYTVANARPVDRRSLDSIMGKGATIAVQPGGMKEQASSRDDQEQAFFPAKLGFVRLAIQHGTPLMPLYIFGENQLYRRVPGMEWFTQGLYKTTGIMLPIVTAKWGLPQAGLLPRATDIHVRYGKPVDVGAAEAEPSDARVEEVFTRYLAELQWVFDTYANDCLPPEVAKRGLKVVRV
jgi:2-acylglycerol O-acyltransferase 2